MYRPVLVTPAAAPPVTLADAKAHLRVEGSDDDTLIESLLSAAIDHLDGWAGILGRCLVEQEWRQDFDCFARCLALPLGPVISIVSVTWRDSVGMESTVDDSEYSLMTDAAGKSWVRFADGFSAPSDLGESAAVRVTFSSGYGAPEKVPAAIRTAIIFMARDMYVGSSASGIVKRETVEGVSTTEFQDTSSIVGRNPVVAALIAPYRRVGI